MKIFFLVFLLFSVKLRAEVWTSKNVWNIEFEVLYSEWVKSTNLSADIFSNPKSPYYGIKTDCADATMALRAIFAFEHQLPIYFKDNDGLFLTNNSLKYDAIPEQIDRLKALLQDIGENIGSEVLASDNTYPISLADVRPGDVYITRWTDASGIDTRHVYFIKDILPTGDLLLFSSTQPRAIRPLLTRKGMPSHIITGEPYGFKRFTSGPKFERPDQSYSQYKDLQKGERFFFSKVKDTHQKVKDTFENNISQRIENICIALQTRVIVVDLAILQAVKNNHQCFSRDEYNEYSTPSRDHNIAYDIESLVFGWKAIKQKQIQSQLSENIQLALEYLAGNDLSEEAHSALNIFCTVKTMININLEISINMRDFYRRYKAGVISNNPNEAIEARWGYTRESGTCPKR